MTSTMSLKAQRCFPSLCRYQRTEAALKTTSERASGLLAGLGARLTEARDSAAVRSLEERVGTMVTSVKVGGCWVPRHPARPRRPGTAPG